MTTIPKNVTQMQKHKTNLTHPKPIQKQLDRQKGCRLRERERHEQMNEKVNKSLQKHKLLKKEKRKRMS